jgi:ABC-type tungstate transport system substrate-binding protein
MLQTEYLHPAIANVTVRSFEIATGKTLEIRQGHNLMTKKGMAGRAAVLGIAGVKAIWVATGEGAGQDLDDNALASEVADARGVGTPSQETTVITGETYQVIATCTYGAGRVITEAGLFDQLAAGGNMWCYQDFAAINTSTTIGIEVTWKIVLG